jgi:hypothetical protein
MGAADGPEDRAPTGRGRRTLRAVAAATVLVAAAVAATGGFAIEVSGVRIRSHSVTRPAVIAAVAFVVWLFTAKRRPLDELTHAWQAVECRAPWLAALLALTTFLAAIHIGAFVAGGADSYGYVSQAEHWTRGQMILPQPLVAEAPWPDPDWVASPLGYRPGPREGTIVATYAPGYPLTMAPLIALGGRTAAFFVVPLLGALAVWATFRIGATAGDPVAGLIGASLLACSPIFLFQLAQPMSDVPVTAWWTAAIVWASRTRRPVASSMAAGLATALAILTRPNLAPMAVFPAALTLRAAAVAGGELRRLGFRRLVAFAVPAALGALAVGAIQAHLYGSPLRSGYGSITEIFSMTNVHANMQRYPRWLLETQTPLVLLGLFAPIALRPSLRPYAPMASAIAWTIAGAAAVMMALYLPYLPFRDWTYLRFLLPALPLLLVGMAMALTALVRPLPPLARASVLLLATLGLCWWYTQVARDRHAMDIGRGEVRYARAGEYLRNAIEPSAVVLGVQHSGSVRFYSGRMTLRWDTIHVDWLDRALEWLKAQGHHPYLVIEDWEEQQFKKRFAGLSPFAALDWPARARIGAVRVYDFDDRARYYAGERVRSVRLP